MVVQTMKMKKIMMNKRKKRFAYVQTSFITTFEQKKEFIL